MSVPNSSQLMLLHRLLLTGLLGFLTFRRIVTPIRALDASVRAIAAGDYVVAVPFVDARDEPGGLARSIDVLKQGAAAMDAQHRGDRAVPPIANHRSSRVAAEACRVRWPRT